MSSWDQMVSDEYIDIRKSGVAGLAHAKIAPGLLVKALILNILSHRTPLCHVASSFRKHDTGLYFGEGVMAEDLTDDRFGWLLDRLAEANPAALFMETSLRALMLHNLQAKSLHADTTWTARVGPSPIRKHQ